MNPKIETIPTPSQTDKKLAENPPVIACHECDLLSVYRPIIGGGRANCPRCGALLYHSVPNSAGKILALNLAALMIFIMANAFPFISLEMSGRTEESVLISGALALARSGMPQLGILVFLTSFLFPLAVIVGHLYVFGFYHLFGVQAPQRAIVYRMVKMISPWSMTAIFLLGVLVAIVKLLDLATVIPGISFAFFVLLMLVMAESHASLDPLIIWPPMPVPDFKKMSGKTAKSNNLLHCHTCGLLVPLKQVAQTAELICPRCGSGLHMRKKDSLSRTWSLVAAALILILPANIYPVMTVIYFGQGEPDTILSGIIHLIHSGMWPLAMIIFIASIVIPIAKLIMLIFLSISVQRKSQWRPKDRTLMYRITESIGAWSMVDVFLLAVLAALVRLDAIATVEPGMGAVFFGSVVVITMLAAQCFDPRNIWDNLRDRS
ncbi:paraquat-inducible protein A [Desulfobacterales bacterium HSG17]|nr:paraquat-inducible protein A [Desulfobacterales bacterium HSG17]